MRFFILSLFVLLMAGCGEKVVPISGTVTLDGKPIKDCSVLFSPTKMEGDEVAAFDSVGKTDENGQYTLTMLGSGKKGAIVCDYIVRLGWSDPNPPQEDDVPPNNPPYKLPKSASEGISFTVPPSGSKTADFNLTND